MSYAHFHSCIPNLFMIQLLPLIRIKEVKSLANIKSAIKRAKIAKTKTFRNRIVMSNMKTMIKKFEQALADGDLETAKNIYPLVVKRIDMAASKGTIHRNSANRKKSKLAILLNQSQIAQ
jgi:small subunit ribosomal protein S20